MPLLIKNRHSQQVFLISRIIQIIDRIVGHGQNPACIHFHYDTAHVLRTVAGSDIIFVFLVKLPQIALHDTLNISINGCLDITAVPGRYGRSFQIGIVIQVPVFPPVRTAECVIIKFLKPVSTLIVIGGKPHHVTGQRAVGIFPLIFILKPHAFNICTVFRIFCQFPESIHLLVFHPARHHIIRRIGMFRNVASHLVHINIKTFFECIQRRLKVLFLLHQNLRIQNDIVHLVADRQHRTVGIHNISTFKRYCRRVILLLRQYLFLILLAVIPGDQEKLCAESAKCCQYKKKQYHQFFLHFQCKSVDRVSVLSPVTQIVTYFISHSTA